MMKIIILSIILLINIHTSWQSKVALDSDGKLQNIVVYIKDDIPEEQSDLIEKIKSYLNEASKSLWTATGVMDPNKRGVQFGTVYIVIPNSWTISGSDVITWQQCSTASIFITTEKENNFKPGPFTMQLGKCGDPGEYTKYPVSYFKTGESFLKGREMMKEFVKLRYGVYTEEPYRNQLTKFVNSQYVYSNCGANIKLTFSASERECEKPDNSCKYKITKGQDHDYSVMFDHSSDKSQYFCDDKLRPHNKDAASVHNVKCNQRSIANVIISHSDFNQKSSKNGFIDTHFVLLKERSRRLVFVLDVSGSMANIIVNMKTAVAQFINEGVENDAEVGLVMFHDYGSIKSYLLSMSNQTNKNTLISIINGLTALSSTNIPDGLRKGIQVLGGDLENNATVFGTIFLLSDGENNVETTIWDNNIVINIIAAKGIVVNTISYGDYGDQKLSLLANVTGGRFYNARTSQAYVDLKTKFSYKSSCEALTTLMKVFEGILTAEIQTGSSDIDFIKIDAFIGNNIVVTVTLNQNLLNYIISIVNPLGKEYFNISSISQSAGYTLGYNISGNVQVGQYKLRFKSSSSIVKRATIPVSLKFVVSAVPNQNSTKLIFPTGKLSITQIQQLDSTTSVLATVDLSSSGLGTKDKIEVLLIMEHSQQSKLERQMLDNGLGCDSLIGDQIFATCLYPKDLKLPGYYSLTANVQIVLDGTNDIIKRTADLASLNVISISSNIQDKIPPARIESVILTVVNASRKHLKFEFEASGDDGVIGNISQYEIKIVSSNETVINVTQNSAPLQPILFTITLENLTSNTSFPVMIRGVDKSGNKGEWSPEQFFSWSLSETIPSKETELPKFSVPIVFNLSIIIICLVWRVFIAHFL